MTLRIKTAAGGLLLSLGMATAGSAATYDFLAAANAGGGIGESIYATYDTSPFFTGPNLRITASATDDDDSDQFVYFDNGNAGIGVCKDATSGASIGTATNGGGNQCDPASDDGITSVSETLTLEATETSVIIESLWFNANHDNDPVTAASYMINGVTYDSGDMIADNVSGSGNYRIDLGFTLAFGETFSITPTSGSPNSYMSAIAVSAVPVPAAGILLLTALGGLGLARQRRRAA